ncbi:hypothetical protein [Caballeronia ptereochthonis]|uniref:Uncharacterized protein n=1 Tax=Caballeronia ptereochthonis TaxID=1777144 RepID=A0A158B432_9BURK|nr:hypothetical protein [Caballeronia ptereochthonis]SAK64769.1 hypothetical protein AWB83_02749 [Caballeronia ptereochthonis]
MPVELDKLPPKRVVPENPPSRQVWTVVFLVLTLAGIFAVLLLWPKDEPTNTPWFWSCVAVFPAGVAGFFVLRRFSVFEGQRRDALEWNKATDDYMNDMFDRASRPLDALTVAYRFSSDADENKFDGLLTGSLQLEPCALPKADTPPAKVRWFAQPDRDKDGRKHLQDEARQADILRRVFGELQDDLKKSIGSLPRQLPTSVRLIVSGSALSANIVECWKQSGAQRGLHLSNVCREPECLVPMWLDAWLDEIEQDRSQDARLLVFVQLNPLLDKGPSEGSCEIALAMLLVPPALTNRYGLIPVAQVHRPERATGKSLDATLTNALRWGRSAATDVEGVWQSGLDLGSAGAMTAALVKSGITIKPGDVDYMVGHAGIGASWFALLCAIKSAASGGTQLAVMKQDAELMFSVVRVPRSKPVNGNR